MSNNVSTLTPAGAAAGILSTAAATGNNSRAGDIAGQFSFGGINTGIQVPKYVWPLALGFVGLIVFLHFRR